MAPQSHSQMTDSEQCSHCSAHFFKHKSDSPSTLSTPFEVRRQHVTAYMLLKLPRAASALFLLYPQPYLHLLTKFPIQYPKYPIPNLSLNL